MRFRTVAVALCLFLLAALSVAQDSHAAWTVKLDPPDARQGESARVLITATIAPGWWIYGMDEKGGPMPVKFEIAGKGLTAEGPAVGPAPHVKFDPNFDKEVKKHEGKVVFALPVRVAGSGEVTAKVNIGWQACDKSQCEIPSKKDFDVKFAVAEGEARADRQTALTAVPDQPAQDATAPAAGDGKDPDEFASGLTNAQKEGMISFIIFAFGAGLLALLTPCVFPMIPITVSFFSKSVGGEKKSNTGGAIAYCLGIITTFTGLGLAVTLLFGATGVQDLGANPWVNIFLVLLFVALAMSLFGAFEIGLPSGLVNKLSAKSRSGALVGPLLMGLTFTLTSFTCTVPFVGTILAGAAAGGGLVYPIVGMLAFSTAFALPFFFLALFPQYLSKLPKSGSWLSTVKAFMGFLELAAALKFLSNVDQVWEYAYISEPIFLAIWASIAFFAAVYLLGWMRLKSDSADQKIGHVRRVVGLGMVVAGVYCLAAIDGAPLGKLSAFLPPGKDKLEWIPTYKSAMELASAQNKPLMIDFTGVTCTNCRDMEKNMFTRTAVNKELEKFVRAKLYTDRSNANDLFNKELLQKLTKSVTLPVYVIQSPDGKTLKVFQGSTDDEEAYVSFLKQGLEAHTSSAGEPVAQEGPEIERVAWLDTFESAQAAAKAEAKPILIDFAAVTSTSSRDFYKVVLAESEINEKLKNFVRVRLYVDRPRADDEANHALQQKLTGSPTVPVLVVLLPNGKTRILREPDLNVERLNRFLDDARLPAMRGSAGPVATRVSP